MDNNSFFTKLTILSVTVAILILGYQVNQLVNEVKSFKKDINDKVNMVEGKISAFTTKHGDDISEEVNALKVDAILFTDSLKIKASDYLKSIK